MRRSLALLALLAGCAASPRPSQVEVVTRLGARPGPHPELDEVPGLVAVSPDELAAIATGTAAARRRARRDLEDLLQEQVLVEVRSGTIRWCLHPRLLGSAPEDLELVGAGRLESALARGAEPDALARALALDPGSPFAAEGARLLGERLLERGSVGEALLAFEDEAARGGEGAATRVALARGLLRGSLGATSGVTDASTLPGDWWAGSVELGAARLCFQGRAIRAFAPALAWSRPEGLPEGTQAVRALGTQSGLAIVLGSRGPAPVLLGVDATGTTRWEVGLPASGVEAPTAHALGLGRVFVARARTLVAIEARSGKIVWTHTRVGGELQPRWVSQGQVIGGLSSQPLPRLDACLLAPLRLSPAGLEVGRGWRLDPRTGAVLVEPVRR